MKPKDFYAMSYEVKRSLSRIQDPHRRGEVKRLMIIAEKAELAANKKRFSGKALTDINEDL